VPANDKANDDADADMEAFLSSLDAEGGEKGEASEAAPDKPGSKMSSGPTIKVSIGPGAAAVAAASATASSSSKGNKTTSGQASAPGAVPVAASNDGTYLGFHSPEFRADTQYVRRQEQERR
jgi:hypothetical protein